VARFTSWLQSREIVPTVVALRQRFEAIRQGELARLEPKMTGLAPEARARVDEITRLIVEKLLLTPTEQLKALSDEATAVAYADALNKLFSLQARGATERDLGFGIRDSADRDSGLGTRDSTDRDSGLGIRDSALADRDSPNEIDSGVVK
jgi:hypothetical protein